jgi:hypothetical protein
VSFPDHLPELRVPVENDGYIPLTIKIGGVVTSDYDVAIWDFVTERPLLSWTANPGPKTPQTRGRYAVFARGTASPKPAECVGLLIVY